MEQSTISFGSMCRKVSAYLPIVMSLAALTIVLADVIAHGAARQTDEGASAHLWQLLVAGQIPFIAYFLLRWLRKAPGTALKVFGVQSAALVAAFAPVFLLRL